MCYGSLTYLEIRRHLDNGALAVIPTGCTEQQGPHLPVDIDSPRCRIPLRTADPDVVWICRLCSPAATMWVGMIP